MALNRTSKFNADEGLFTNTVPEKRPVIKDTPKEVETAKTVKPVIKKRAFLPDEKKKIMRSYAIGKEDYELFKAMIQIMRDNGIVSKTDGLLITESAFVREAIQDSMHRVFVANDSEFETKVRERATRKPRSGKPIKY